jgi:formylglycine-generating enzyme required for sulfatase activity
MAIDDELAPIPGGRFRMGSEAPDAYAQDGEGPVRSVEVAAFGLHPHAVTNAAFAAFAAATGYRTDAERYGWSFVFAGLLPADAPATRGVAQAPWWRQVDGAHWRRPEGPGSEIDARLAHPVVHVSLADARAYCRWGGWRLPSEPEWERAARGGLDGRAFPWGDELEPGGEHRMNVWQGDFPRANRCDDGWYGTCPVDAFAPNAYGLHNMTGNVWEWCEGDGVAVMRGGSYLCHASYCRRYRVSARSLSTPDSASGNTGFRVAGELTGGPTPRPRTAARRTAGAAAPCAARA